MGFREVIKSKTNINFAAKFMPCLIVSTIMVVICIVLVFTRLKYGVDFRGGSELQIKFKDAVSIADVRSKLSSGGFSGASVQTIGEASENEMIIKVSGEDNNLNKISEDVVLLLNTNFAAAGVEIRKIDIVGPKAGAQLRLSGFQAMMWALLAIMIYIALRFDFKYAPGAIVATFHDVALVLGVYAIFGVEFTLQTVAALLAVIGYSVNDTVIVYDRVREHEQKGESKSLVDTINLATNETLSRTILTSGTTLFVCIAMLAFGGGAIRDFFIAMTVGIIVGTYSSVYIAAPVTLFMEKILSKNTNKNIVANAK